jgi:hypothetical protein
MVGSGDSFENCYLMPTVHYLLLQALFTKSSHGEQLLAPSSLLQWRSFSAYYYCRFCLLKVFMESSSLLLPPSLVPSEHPTPSAACPFQFLVYYYFFVGRGSVFPGGYAGLSHRWVGEYCVTLVAHLLVC